jgi:very-short-patch-repair endonuclease
MGCTVETISITTLAIVLLLIVALMIWALLARKAKPELNKKPSVDDMKVWPYVPRELMTAPERELYRRLQQALPDYLIFSQVQLSRLIDVAPDAEKQAWLNRINRMSVDFVVCANDGAKILAAIELDDSSHNLPERIKADSKKDKALKSAGIPMIRWPVKGMPAAPQLRADFLKRR